MAQPTLHLNPGANPLTTCALLVAIETTVLTRAHLILVALLALEKAIMLDCAALVVDMAFVLNHVPVFQMELFPLHPLSTRRLLAMPTLGLIPTPMVRFVISLALTATVLRRTHACPQSLSIQMMRALFRHYRLSKTLTRTPHTVPVTSSPTCRKRIQI